MPKTMEELAKDAIQLQDACNGSGVAHTLVRMYSDLRELGVTDTNALNRHPVIQLTLFKLMSLADCQVNMDDFERAYEACRCLQS